MSDEQKKSTAVVRTEDRAQFGPAMQALPDDTWRAFVLAVVHDGVSARAAALAAGFKGRSAGHRLAHDPRIQAALLEEGLKLIRVDSVQALHVLREIAFDTSAAHRDRLKAIEMILSRGGFAATTHHQVDVVHKTDAQLKQELLAMAEELGMDAAAKAKLLGGPVTDVDFVEVIERGGSTELSIEAQAMSSEARQVRSAEPNASLEGLEDLVPQEPLANEVGQETDFDPTDDGDGT